MTISDINIFDLNTSRPYSPYSKIEIEVCDSNTGDFITRSTVYVDQAFVQPGPWRDFKYLLNSIKAFFYLTPKYPLSIKAVRDPIVQMWRQDGYDEGLDRWELDGRLIIKEIAPNMTGELGLGFSLYPSNRFCDFVSLKDCIVTIISIDPETYKVYY